MPQRYIVAIMISLILITLAVIFHGQRPQLNHTSIHAKQGLIDISPAIEQGQSVDLSGEWLFFYDQFLSSKEIQAGTDLIMLQMAKDKKLDEILEELGEVAEGVKTSEAIYKLSKEYNIYTPIANEVKLILEGKSPQDSLKYLLNS